MGPLLCQLTHPPASRTPVIPVSLFQIHYIAMLDRSQMSSSWLFALLRGSLRLPSPSELPSSCQDAADHLAARPTRLGLPSVPPHPVSTTVISSKYLHLLDVLPTCKPCTIKKEEAVAEFKRKFQFSRHGVSITTERAVFTLHILAEAYFTGSQDLSAQNRQILLYSLSFVCVTHSKKPIPSEQLCSD